MLFFFLAAAYDRKGVVNLHSRKARNRQHVNEVRGMYVSGAVRIRCYRFAKSARDPALKNVGPVQSRIPFVSAGSLADLNRGGARHLIRRRIRQRSGAESVIDPASKNVDPVLSRIPFVRAGSLADLNR